MRLVWTGRSGDANRLSDRGIREGGHKRGYAKHNRCLLAHFSGLTQARQSRYKPNKSIEVRRKTNNKVIMLAAALWGEPQRVRMLWLLLLVMFAKKRNFPKSIPISKSIIVGVIAAVGILSVRILIKDKRSSGFKIDQALEVKKDCGRRLCGA